MRTTLTLLAALACNLSAENICGKRLNYSDGTRVEVACIDWPALARFIPGLQGRPPQTQVWVYTPSGTAIRVVVDGETQFNDLVDNPPVGGKVSAVVYDGIEHETMDAAVLDRRPQ